MSVRQLVDTVFRYGVCVPGRATGPSYADRWFREEPRGRTALELQRRYAREACADCPVRAECLMVALSHEEESGASWGIWGGVCARDRQAAIARASEEHPDDAMNIAEVAQWLLSGERVTCAVARLRPDTVDDQQPERLAS